MVKEGYIERAIRQLRQVFAALMGKVDRTENPAVLDAQLDELYREHLGIARQTLASLDEASQLRILRERAYVSTELLRGERDLLAAAGRDREAAEVGALLALVETKASA